MPFEDLAFTVVPGSTHAPGCVAENLVKRSRKSFWQAFGRFPSTFDIKLRLDETSLVGFVRIDNRTTSRLEILTAMKDEPGAYVTVQSTTPVPHNKPTTYRASFLPARYVILRCIGGPAGMYSVQLAGMRADNNSVHAATRHMLVDETLDLFYKPSVKPRRVRIVEWCSLPLEMTSDPCARATRGQQHTNNEDATEEEEIM